MGGNKEKDRQSGCDYVRSINLDGGRSLKHILISMSYNLLTLCQGLLAKTSKMDSSKGV